MEILEREKLRMHLISLGADVVIGVARGEGDSADEFGVRAARYIMPGPDVKVEVVKSEEKHPMGWTTNTEHVKVWEKGVLVLDDRTYMRHSAANTSGEFFGLRGEYRGAEASVEVELPKGLREDLMGLFEEVVGDHPWWDFNNDGSFGEFMWNLKSNKARVEGGINIPTVEERTEDDPLGMEGEE